MKHLTRPLALLLALGVAWSATASYRQLMGDDFRGEAARWRALGQIFDPSDFGPA